MSPVPELTSDFLEPVVFASAGGLAFLYILLVLWELCLLVFGLFVFCFQQLERVGVVTDPPPAATVAYVTTCFLSS